MLGRYRKRRWASAVAGALGISGALFLADWFQHGRPEAFWFARRLATIWLWQLVLSASCLAAGHWAVARWIPARERGRLDTLAISFPVGVAIFVLGMYVGGFLHLFGPAFAVAWPALLLIATAPATRRAMDVTLAELGSEDWRKLQAAGKESFTQAIGRAVAAAGGSGLLSRSAAVDRGVNVAVFPGVCAADRLEVVEGAKLEKLGVKAED